MINRYESNNNNKNRPMKAIINFITFFTVILVFASCNKEISWDAQSADTKLVVQGVITDELKNHQVKLSKTMSYDSNKAEYVTGATISISDGTNVFQLTEVGNGFYETDLIAGEVGKEYTLNITLKENIGGYNKFSASSEMKGYFDIDESFCFLNEHYSDEEDTATTLLVVLFGQEAPTEDDYYLFQLKKLGSSQEFSINDQSTFADYGDNGMNDIALLYTIEDSIPIGDSLEITVHSISEDYLIYMDEVFTEIDRYDPFGMMGPAANPKGNISGGAFGFFRASTTRSFKPIIVAPELE